jgi:hypothetical protein
MFPENLKMDSEQLIISKMPLERLQLIISLQDQRFPKESYYKLI